MSYLLVGNQISRHLKTKVYHVKEVRPGWCNEKFENLSSRNETVKH